MKGKIYSEITIYEIIEEGDKDRTIMSRASKGKDDVEERRLVMDHAYTLIGTKKWAERNIPYFLD